METARPPGSLSAPLGCPLVAPFVWLGKHLYTTNPFYLISAGLILLGLNFQFYDHAAAAHPRADTFNSWQLLAVLGGYAVVLAITSLVIVRLGQVWDDARTILLTLVILFAAMSVSFDKLVLTSSTTMTQVLATGLAFSIGLSELLLCGLRIRLPGLFRMPFYAALGLYFLYPILLMYLLDDWGDGAPHRAMEWTMWGVLLFPAAAAVITLSLLPAIWRGPEYVADNGTPWRWPLYPWSLFAFLGVGVVLRSYYLSLSFHPFPGVASGFGPYILMPFLLSVVVVVFELARSVGSIGVERFSLSVPLALVWLSLPGARHSAAFEHVLTVFMARAGSPVVVTWWGVVIFYLYAWLRGARLAEIGVVAMLVLGSVLGPRTLDVHSIRFPAAEPLGVATVWLCVLAILRPLHSARWFLAVSGAVVTLTIAFFDTPFIAHAGLVPVHLLLGTVLMLGIVFDDAFARFLRQLGTLGLAAVGVLSLTNSRLIAVLPRDLLLAYLATLTVVSWSYWFTLRGRLQFFAASLLTACWLGHVGLAAVSVLRRLLNSTGALLLLGSAGSFLAGLGISLLKVRNWRLRESSAAAPPENDAVN